MEINDALIHDKEEQIMDVFDLIIFQNNGNYYDYNEQEALRKVNHFDLLIKNYRNGSNDIKKQNMKREDFEQDELDGEGENEEEENDGSEC